MLNRVFSDTETMVVSAVDGKPYNVMETFDDSDIAADKIAMANKTCELLIDHMSRKYRHLHGSRGNMIYERLARLYDPRSFFEHLPNDTSITAYTIEKGKKIAMCLRGQENFHKLHKNEILQFVVLHELAHIGSKEYQHGDEFWDNFKLILREAAEAGIYKPVDYSKNPVNYCGLNINSSPLF